MTAYDEKDAAKDTDVSAKEVRECYHYAREVARESGEADDWDDSDGDDSGSSDDD